MRANLSPVTGFFAFKTAISRQLRCGHTARPGGHGLLEKGDTGMSAKWIRNLIIILYVVIGGFIAWDHGYMNIAWLRTLASAILAIFLWWLILLGVNLHVHG